MNHSESPKSCDDSGIGNIKVFHQPRNVTAHNMAHRLATQQAFTPECLNDVIKEIDRLQVIEYEHQAIVAQQSVLVKPNHSPDTGNKVDHCVEANEMRRHPDSGSLLVLGAMVEAGHPPNSTANQINIAADELDRIFDLLARTEAKRVEAEEALHNIRAVADDASAHNNIVMREALFVIIRRCDQSKRIGESNGC